MKGRLNRQGFIKGIFIIALLVAVVFLMISFGRPYYRYYTLDHYAYDELLIEVGNTGVIRQKVLQRASELGVPLDPDNLQVTQDENRKVVTVTAHWTDVVDLWGYYTKKIDFTLKESN